MEEIINSQFSGFLKYSNAGMRHDEEMKTFDLNAGDRVVIFRKNSKVDN